jgi:hypothetical protein
MATEELGLWEGLLIFSVGVFAGTSYDSIFYFTYLFTVYCIEQQDGGVCERKRHCQICASDDT